MVAGASPGKTMTESKPKKRLALVAGGAAIAAVLYRVLFDASTAKAQVVVGSAVASTPLWLSTVETVSSIAAMIAGITGAIIGLHGVYMIIRRYVVKD